MPLDTHTSDKSERHDGWNTLRRFLPYLWPADNKALRWRIVGAVLLVIAGKAVTLLLPFAYKRAVDTMTLTGDPPGSTASSFARPSGLVADDGRGSSASSASITMPTRRWSPATRHTIWPFG